MLLVVMLTWRSLLPLTPLVPCAAANRLPPDFLPPDLGRSFPNLEYNFIIFFLPQLKISTSLMLAAMSNKTSETEVMDRTCISYYFSLDIHESPRFESFWHHVVRIMSFSLQKVRNLNFLNFYDYSVPFWLPWRSWWEIEM